MNKQILALLKRDVTRRVTNGILSVLKGLKK